MAAILHANEEKLRKELHMSSFVNKSPNVHNGLTTQPLIVYVMQTVIDVFFRQDIYI